jgi:L-fuconolactonase
MSAPEVRGPRIDSHQHFWRYDPRAYGWIDERMDVLKRDFLPADLEPPMRAAGFDGVVAVQARQTLEETAALLEWADRCPFVAGVVGWVDLCSADLRRQLGRFARHPRLVGVRHIVQGEPDDRFLLRPDFGRGIALLEEFGLAYDILIYARHLPVATEFVRRFPRQPFVLDHLAKPDVARGEIRNWSRDLRALAEAPNVSAKLSGLVTEADWTAWTADQIRPYLDVAFESFGAGRLMIGSDWPVCTLAGDYGRTMRVVTDYLADRPAAEREAVLGGNAQAFWNLEVKERSRCG